MHFQKPELTVLERSRRGILDEIFDDEDDSEEEEDEDYETEESTEGVSRLLSSEAFSKISETLGFIVYLKISFE